MTAEVPGLDMSPRWARLAYVYERSLPNHPGKRTVLRAAYRVADRYGRPFVWRMQNGALLALSPRELLHDFTVGWSCFHERVWEPHVEAALRRLLRPGDTAYDIGANIGYFSAVMADAVGPTGRVFAFEPVPETFERLDQCRELNGFSQLTPLKLAVGESDTSVEVAISRSSLGQASIYDQPNEVNPFFVRVAMRRLDDLLIGGDLSPPALIKMDVEGHELPVMQGARQLIAEHLPALIFELNAAMSRKAGWTSSQIAALLRECGEYRFFLLGEHPPRPLDLETLEMHGDTYVDVLALI
jgi:FkbM family methyltransferase